MAGVSWVDSCKLPEKAGLKFIGLWLGSSAIYWITGLLYLGLQNYYTLDYGVLYLGLQDDYILDYRI